MPWVLDVAFQEDDCGIRRAQAPHNPAILWCIPLHVLPQEKTTRLGIAHKWLKAARDPQYRRKLLAILF